MSASAAMKPLPAELDRRLEVPPDRRFPRSALGRERSAEPQAAGGSLFAAIFAAAADAILVADDQGRYVEANPAALRLLGYRRDELIGRAVSEVVERIETGGSDRLAWDAWSNSGEQSGVAWLRRAGGGLIEMEHHAVAGICPGLHLSILRDPSGRRHRDRRLRLLFDENPLPMWVFDLETLRFVAVNRATAERYGYSEEELLGGMTILDIRPPEDVPATQEILARVRADGRPTMRSVRHRCRHRCRGGEILDVEVVGRSLEIDGRACRFIVAHDVTEQRRLQDALGQTQKMDAIGRIVGGVAHDFNNLLTAITGYTALAQAQLPAGSPVIDDLCEIETAAERASQLTRQFLAFSRKQILHPVVLEIGGVIRDTERMLRRILGEDIQLTTDLAESAWPIRVDPGQLQQVLLNLAVNARDAMPTGGELSLRTRKRELVAGEASALPAGPYLELTVTDTGCGMSAEVRERVFEPFFTTKAPGSGTGLGLATVYGIVRQSGGAIEVASEPGRGSRFRLLLPAATGESSALRAEHRGAPAVDGGSETILLAEDEPQVAELAARILHEAGYRVVIARDGDEAVAIGKALGPALDLLVADVVMPRRNGDAAAAAIRLLHPGLPALYMSGYTVENMSRHGVDESSLHFLAKPFTAPALLRAVRQTLDGRGAPAPGDQGTGEEGSGEPGASRISSSTAASNSEALNGLGRNRSAAWRTGASSA